MVAHAASRAGAEHPRWRRHGARHGSSHVLESARAAVPGDRAGHGTHAAIRRFARNRFAAPAAPLILIGERSNEATEARVPVHGFHRRLADPDRVPGSAVGARSETPARTGS